MGSPGDAFSGSRPVGMPDFGGGMQILVVDDEPSIVRMLKFSFERLGHEVVAAANGVAALSCFQPGVTSLIMLDIMMPGMDGLSLCRHWRDEGVTVPIIFLTARPEQYPGEYGEAGATDWIQKPCSLRELLAPIHRYNAPFVDSRG